MIEYLIIIISSVALFWRAVFCGLTADDVQMHPWAQEYKHLYKYKKIPFSRMIWHVLQGGGLFKSLKHDYAFSILLHTANACLILKVTGLLPAALLWLCNPINNQVSLWLNGRRYAITIFCVLASWACWPLGIVLYPFAVWLHVSGAAFPLLFLATPAWPVIPVGLFGCYAIGFKKFKEIFVSRASQYHKETEMTKIHLGKVVFYFKHLAEYVKITLFPFKPGMYHNFHFYFPRHQWAIDKAYKIDAQFFTGLAIFAYMVFEMAVNHNFWAFWFLLFISQYCGICTVTMNTADRYCSLAGIGLMVMLAQKIVLLPQPYDTAVLFAFLAFYSVGYNPLFYAYKGWERFMLYHINLHPVGSRQRVHLATYYLKLKDHFSAFYVVKKGLQLNPHDFDLLYMMTQLSMMLNAPAKQILDIVDRAEQHIPLHDEEFCKSELNKVRAAVKGAVKR